MRSRAHYAVDYAVDYAVGRKKSNSLHDKELQCIFALALVHTMRIMR